MESILLDFTSVEEVNLMFRKFFIKLFLNKEHQKKVKELTNKGLQAIGNQIISNAFK